MVHYGSAPPPLGAAGLAAPGDVVTHGYNGGTNGVLDGAGQVEASAWEARRRG